MLRASATLMKGLPRAPIMNRAKRGLFHGKHILFGNTRSHSEMKSRRTWVPNTHPKTYFSNVLGRNCSFSVSAKAIRCIDKAGGFDSYILRTRDEYLGYEGSSGVALKHEMLAALHLPKTSSKDEITARIRARMGLPVVPIDFEALRKSVAEGVAKETVASA